jgi:HTH-type transcriptional regulator / antitoxin HigA
MQMSLRYVTDDQFWLTFFHEAGHLMLHGKRDLFLEGSASLQAKEDEADRFAFDVLLPEEKLARIAADGPPAREDIRRLAVSLDLAPGVLVGLLQHRGILPHSQYNDFKRLFRLQPV